MPKFQTFFSISGRLCRHRHGSIGDISSENIKPVEKILGEEHRIRPSDISRNLSRELLYVIRILCFDDLFNPKQKILSLLGKSAPRTSNMGQISSTYMNLFLTKNYWVFINSFRQYEQRGVTFSLLHRMNGMCNRI